jgi:hypothetical protein
MTTVPKKPKRKSLQRGIAQVRNGARGSTISAPDAPLHTAKPTEPRNVSGDRHSASYAMRKILAIVFAETRDTEAYVPLEGHDVRIEGNRAFFKLLPNSRCAIPHMIYRDLVQMYPDTITADGGFWLHDALTFGVEAVFETASDLAMLGDLSRFGANTLTILGDLISKHFRAKILLDQLKATNWNLAHTAERLRLGYGTANVLRTIHDLGLTEEYEKAKAAGKIKRGGRRPRVEIPK